MKPSEIELPSDKKFGYFFSLIFFLLSLYFYYTSNIMMAYTFSGLTLIFFFITFLNDALLHPLNKLWMRFGILLSMIVSPIIMGIIFFGMFTPMSIIMRIFKRDELKIRSINKETYWVLRSFPRGKELVDSFKQQY